MNSFETLPRQDRCPYYLFRLLVAVGCPYSVAKTSERYGLAVPQHG